MANVYSLYPFFSETALLTIMNDLYHRDDRVIKDSDLWLFHMVIAIASAAQSRVIHDEHYQNGVSFARKALESADRALAPGYVTQIQSLLLLTQYSMLDPAHFDSWHLIGFTTRAVVDLGLHQDPPLASMPDKSALDMRRKIFHCVYSLDRYGSPLDIPLRYRQANPLISAISMVHARTFSFTDNSINVAFPSCSAKDNTPKPMTAPQSSDPALLLFQLRRAQSFWYQELYQSHSAAPLHDPTSFVWRMCYDMREWGESLPQTLPPAVRQLFDQELRYSYVYCIAPSGRAPEISDYSRTLIFEYAVAYLDTMHEIAHNSLNNAFYTYHDALKVYFMANQLLAVLSDSEDMLLMGHPVPPPMSRSGGPPPPPVPRRPMAPGMPMPNNLRRSVHCLERVDQTLGKFGERWEESAMLKLSFESISGDTMERLRRRMDMQDAAMDHHQQQHSHFQNGVPMSLNGQGQPREMRFIGVNPAGMMRGPPPQ